MKRYQELARREHPLNRRLLLLAFAAPVFLLLLPLLLYWGGRGLDRLLHLPVLYFGIANWVLGLTLALAGFAFGMWSIVAQVTQGHGTPVPVMPTVRLVIQPPFTYCRNPMTLGTGVAYAGIACLLGSLGALIIVLILVTLLLGYIKFIEEKELVLRFGQEYAEYKQRTPFIIPRCPPRP